MLRTKLFSAGLAALALGSGPAAASAAVDAALGNVFALLGIAVILWVFGNLLTYHRYDHGGPKGGPVEKP